MTYTFNGDLTQLRRILLDGEYINYDNIVFRGEGDLWGIESQEAEYFDGIRVNHTLTNFFILNGTKYFLIERFVIYDNDTHQTFDIVAFSDTKTNPLKYYITSY